MPSEKLCRRKVTCSKPDRHVGACRYDLFENFDHLHCRCSRPHPTYSHAGFGVTICGRCLRPIGVTS